MNDGRSVRIEARLDRVRELADAARLAGQEAGLGAHALIDLELALVEAANNIVSHGYAGKSGEIQMIARGSAEGMLIELVDTGARIPADWLAAPPHAAMDAERGRGLAIINACVDRVDYASEGGYNRLTLFKMREG